MRRGRRWDIIGGGNAARRSRTRLAAAPLRQVVLAALFLHFGKPLPMPSFFDVLVLRLESRVENQRSIGNQVGDAVESEGKTIELEKING